LHWRLRHPLDCRIRPLAQPAWEIKMPPTDEIVSAKPNKPKASATEPTRVTEPAPDSEPPRALWPPSATEEPLATTEPPPGADLIALTIDTTNARIVTIEHVDASGARKPLSKEEKSRLAEARPGARLEHLLEQAFEAGIEFVLGANDEDEPAESKDDYELNRLLLQSLIERSRAKRLIESGSIDHALLGTLMGRAAKAR
jgi:hypothetical protein